MTIDTKMRDRVGKQLASLVETVIPGPRREILFTIAVDGPGNIFKLNR